MTHCLFVSDLHGDPDRYHNLFLAVAAERPEAVFIGGDLFPWIFPRSGRSHSSPRDFIKDYLAKRLESLRRDLKTAYPRVFLIMGNDDPRAEEAAVEEAGARGLWDYVHARKVPFENYVVYGYAHVPPTPFHLKDWERYDVSRYVDPGSVSPEEGFRTVPVSEQEIKHATIKDDLERLAGDDDLRNAVFLFHSPPYQSQLDQTGLERKMIDHVPLDRHLGSIAIKRFIQGRQPLLTLHGHIHESARLSGSWRDRIGQTYCFSAAHDGRELALVRFDLQNLEAATREFV
jgi:Icc-related predicted phosphoesterase